MQFTWKTVSQWTGVQENNLPKVFYRKKRQLCESVPKCAPRYAWPLEQCSAKQHKICLFLLDLFKCIKCKQMEIIYVKNECCLFLLCWVISKNACDKDSFKYATVVLRLLLSPVKSRRYTMWRLWVGVHCVRLVLRALGENDKQRDSNLRHFCEKIPFTPQRS